MRGGETDYRMMTRQVCNAVLALPEVNRFTKGIYAWVGFRTRWLEFENVDRAVGECKWSFWGLVRYSIQGLSAFSAAPLQLASVLGLVCCLAALVYLLYILGKTWLVGEAVGGWPTLACLILFLGGLQLSSLSVSLALTWPRSISKPSTARSTLSRRSANDDTSL